ncbi:MAG TPA: hypothetical protein VM513_13345 [Kofleriaceae bacterium]|jgi:hypothetical protein|nr:hypothetical protein [Kofleriaceae bacterium]
MSSALCPYCRELVRTIRNPRRNHGAETLAYLDLHPVGFQTVGELDRLVKVAAIVEFSADGEKGAQVFAPAWVNPESKRRGFVLHRVNCPAWPELSRNAPIRRFNEEKVP